jgi:4-hydroxybenzoate polyprenyltransferase
MITHLLSLLRVHQYVKNLFIAAPLFFSFSFDIDSIEHILLVIIIFSLTASSIYIFNDLVDIEEDRKHYSKCNRPLAKGVISPKRAIIIMIILLSISLISIGLINIELLGLFIGYILMNVAYSLSLKHIVIVDIVVIAFGFVLRLFIGGVASNVHVSMWIVIMTFLLSLFLALAKRRDDILLALKGVKARKNIDGYNLEFVNASMVLMASVTVVSYIFYTMSVNTINSEYLYLTTLFVIIGILRYMQLTFVEQNSGSPTKVLLKDNVLKSVILLWILAFFVIKYLGE